MLVGAAPASRGPTSPPRDEAFSTLADHVDGATRAHIADALERSGGVKHEAARLLGIERTTLYRLLKKGDA
jgi:two-component system response regulator PilR (NtrC family)